MRSLISCVRRVVIALTLSLLVFQRIAPAQVPAKPFLFRLFSEIEAHRHDPIELISRPMVKRYPTQLFRPRRVVVDSSGNALLADWAAGLVAKVSPEGDTEIIADDLNEPAGLALDRFGNLYVSQHAQGIPGTGSIIKISPEGERSIFAEGFTGPSGIAIDNAGNLFVANFHDNSISLVNPAGEVRDFAINIPQPAAVVLDESGFLYAVSSTEGTVLRFDAEGNHIVLARGFMIPSDITIDSQGHLIVANFGDTSLSMVSRKGNVRTFAKVPKGTISVCFDPQGNILLTNWDDHYLMKISSHLSIPCPHCSKRIPIRLRSPQKQPKPTSTPAQKRVKVI